MRSVFIFQGRGIGLDNYKGYEFMSRVVVQLKHLILLNMVIRHQGLKIIMAYWMFGQLITLMDINPEQANQPQLH